MSIKIKGYNARSRSETQEYIHYTHNEIHNKLIHTILMSEIKSKVRFVI